MFPYVRDIAIKEVIGDRSVRKESEIDRNARFEYKTTVEVKRFELERKRNHTRKEHVRKIEGELRMEERELREREREREIFLSPS